jgi:uncharacterized membrane protein YgaE (UPF0421/DUF939 family)
MNPRIWDMIFASIVGYGIGALLFFMNTNWWLALLVAVTWATGTLYKLQNQNKGD